MADSERPRATLYVFFATWCVPCRVELPHIERLHRTYQPRGLRVVLVSEDEPSTRQNIPAFLARYRVTAPWFLDNESQLVSRYNQSATVPFAVVLDDQDKVVYAHAGYEPGDERLLESAISAILGKKTPAQAASEAATPARPSATRVQSVTQGLGVWRRSRFDAQRPENDRRLRATFGRVEVAGDAPLLRGRGRALIRADGAILDDDSEIAATMENTELRLERVAVGWNRDSIRAHLGDDYASFGHGLSLSLRKVDPLGLDTSLRGGSLALDTTPVRAKVIAGVTNPQNLDPLTFRLVDDDSDLIAGSELSLELGPLGRIAPYALFVRAFEASPTGEDIDWMIGGTSSSLRVGELTIASELAIGRRTGLAIDDERTYAAYTSMQVPMGEVTILIEGKLYRRWEIGREDRALLYHEPPTLEREDQQVPSNEDAVGGRVRLEWRLPSSYTAFGSLLGYKFAADTSDPFSGGTAAHGYVGLDKRFGRTGSANLQVGYRREFEPDGDDSIRLVQVDADSAWRISSRLAASIKWNHWEETKALFNEIDFRRGLAIAGLSLSGIGTVSALYGYSTELASTPTHYPAGEVLLHLPKGGSVRLFVGRLVGGRVCVSGSCRTVPPFEGARLDLVFNASAARN